MFQGVKAACGIRDDLKGGDAKVHIVEETDPPPSKMVELLGSPEPIKVTSIKLRSHQGNFNYTQNPR